MDIFISEAALLNTITNKVIVVNIEIKAQSCLGSLHTITYTFSRNHI